MCVCLLLFFSQHMEQLFQPLTCLSREGKSVMKADQQIECDAWKPEESERYRYMFVPQKSQH